MPEQTVFLLTHHDDGDYYQKHETRLGLYSTEEKAVAKFEKEQKRGQYKGPLVTPRDNAGVDNYFEIERCVIDPD